MGSKNVQVLGKFLRHRGGGWRKKWAYNLKYIISTFKNVDIWHENNSRPLLTFYSCDDTILRSGVGLDFFLDFHQFIFLDFHQFSLFFASPSNLIIWIGLDCITVWLKKFLGGLKNLGRCCKQKIGVLHAKADNLFWDNLKAIPSKNK